MCEMCELLLRQLYDVTRKQDERNYAHGHSFAEWRAYYLNDNGFHIIEGERVPWAGKSNGTVAELFSRIEDGRALIDKGDCDYKHAFETVEQQAKRLSA